MINILKSAGLIHQMIQITGEPDTGKTLFALQSGAMPEETVFIDADVKGRATVEQLLKAGFKFGMYVDMVSGISGMKEVAHHEYGLEVIEKIAKLPEKKRRVICWDTFEPFEKTFKPFVTRNPGDFRDYYSPMGSIKGAEQWLASFDYEAEIINKLVGLCELLILVSHVKNYNISGKRVDGKFIPDNKKPVMQKALMRIWLRHNPESPVPIGLVLKRLGKTTAKKGVGIRAQNVLPRRVAPELEEESLWDAIKRYWKKPIGNRKPEAHEAPNKFELSILDGTLTEDQKIAFKAALVQEAQEEELFGDSKLEEAREMQEDGKNFPEIAEYFGKSVPEAVAWLNE